MAKKSKSNRLYLLVRDPNNITKEFVWATNGELDKYYRLGFIRLNKG